MENSTDTPEPTPKTPALPLDTPAAEPDELMRLAHAAKAARLAPADEERAATLLKERLTGGRAGINAAIPAMIEGLPWIVCVNAVSAVWEQLSVPMRRHLLGGIAKNETESARRLRLSLSRAVFKLEPATGLKLAAAAAADLKDPQTGALTAKYRQFFFNVYIGKGKPWLLQLPLADLKPAEADVLVHCALECFPICPPLSQLSILRWADGAGRLKKLAPGDIETICKAVARWNTKLQRQLKKEVAGLPEPVEAVLKPEALKDEPEPAAAPAPKPEAKRNEPRKSQRPPKGTAPQNETPQPAPEGTEEPAPAAAPLVELIIPGRAERLAKKEEEKLSKKEPEPERRPERREEPRVEKPGRAFDLKDALRGVESYVATLRTELEQAKTQLRRQERDEKRAPRTTRTVVEMPPAEVEALTRHNARLEQTVAELRAQLEDLASHHEEVAESRQLHSGEPLEQNEAAQLKALLAIKLQENYETYEAMRLEPLDRVFRLDYRDLLGSVFETLREAGVPFKK